MKHNLFLAVLLLCLSVQAFAQDTPKRLSTQNRRSFNNSQSDFDNISDQGDYSDPAGNRTTWGRDSTKHAKQKKIPVGMFQWVLEPRLGTIIDAENNDTVILNFQNFNNPDSYTGEYLAGPTITSRGFIYMKEAEDLLEEATILATEKLEKLRGQGVSDWGRLKGAIRDVLGDFFRKKTKRNPMILSIFEEV